MSAASSAFSTDGHVVIVGASLAGLRAAEALRKGGFGGRLTLVGDEPYEPYDRPPLSKQVLAGRIPPESTALPQDSGLEAEWRLGTPAVGLDPPRAVDDRRPLQAMPETVSSHRDDLQPDR